MTSLSSSLTSHVLVIVDSDPACAKIGVPRLSPLAAVACIFQLTRSQLEEPCPPASASWSPFSCHCHIFDPPHWLWLCSLTVHAGPVTDRPSCPCPRVDRNIVPWVPSTSRLHPLPRPYHLFSVLTTAPLPPTIAQLFYEDCSPDLDFRSLLNPHIR